MERYTFKIVIGTSIEVIIYLNQKHYYKTFSLLVSDNFMWHCMEPLFVTKTMLVCIGNILGRAAVMNTTIHLQNPLAWQSTLLCALTHNYPFCPDPQLHLFLWPTTAPFALTHNCPFYTDTQLPLLPWHKTIPFALTHNCPFSSDTPLRLLPWHKTTPFALTHNYPFCPDTQLPLLPWH